MSVMRILVVDDNKVQTTALSMKLKAQGYEVLVASDGSEAISIARREKLDLILLDIVFPPDVGHGGGVAWDGFLILSWLRRMEETRMQLLSYIALDWQARRSFEEDIVRWFK